MNKYITVYFDTYFYIWLAIATDEEANEIISELNRLKVRHVLSGQVILELLSNHNKPDKDKILVNRMSKFEIEPYKISSSIFEDSLTSDSLSWDILLLEGEARISLANLFKLIFDLQAKAESWSILAQNKYISEKQEKIQESLDPFLSLVGFDKDEKYTNEETAQKHLAFQSEMFSDLFSILPENPFGNFENINFAMEPTAENLINLSNEIKVAVGNENINKLEEDKKIIHSVTNSDDRPYKVVVGEASKKEEKNLGNTLRDSNNMSLFVTHQNEIDLLQLDSAQINLIKNKGKELHRLVELNLDNRCFCSNSLKNTVEVIKEKKQEVSL